MTSEDRERIVVRRLRRLVAALGVVGAATVAIGYVPITVTDLQYVDHVDRAGGDLLTLFVVALLLPGVWVLWRPRWPQILVWTLWAVSWAMLAGLFHLGTSVPYEMVTPIWPTLSIFGGVATLVLGVWVVVPLVRATHRSPPLPRPTRLPVARVRT